MVFSGSHEGSWPKAGLGKEPSRACEAAEVLAKWQYVSMLEAAVPEEDWKESVVERLRVLRLEGKRDVVVVKIPDMYTDQQAQWAELLVSHLADKLGITALWIPESVQIGVLCLPDEGKPLSEAKVG